MSPVTGVYNPSKTPEFRLLHNSNPMPSGVRAAPE